MGLGGASRAGPFLSDARVGGRQAPGRQTALAKLHARPGVLCFGARRARWRPPAAGQAPARVICSGSGPYPAHHVLTFVPAARPCPQTPPPAGMEPVAEEHESADESAALGGALRAPIAASLFRSASDSPLPSRTAPVPPRAFICVASDDEGLRCRLHSACVSCVLVRSCLCPWQGAAS